MHNANLLSRKVLPMKTPKNSVKETLLHCIHSCQNILLSFHLCQLTTRKHSSEFEHVLTGTASEDEQFSYVYDQSKFILPKTANSAKLKCKTHILRRLGRWEEIPLGESQRRGFKYNQILKDMKNSKDLEERE